MDLRSVSRCFLHSIVLGAALAGALTGCSGSDSSAAPAGARPPMPVTVLQMQPRRVPVTVEVMGETEGARETQVRARVSGILLKRLYEEGETVSAGQPLFQIDPATYKIALTEARARADQAAREVRRLKGLVHTKAVSRREYDDAVSANAIAQANLRRAKLDLSWTKVTAPVSGTTGRALKSEGDLISAGSDSLLTSIYQLDPIWVRFSLGQSDMAKLPGRLTADQVSGVELVLPDGSVYPEHGKLNFLASNIDRTLGTRQARAAFPNPDRKLLPGQFVRVRLLLGERDGVFLVPQEAVIQTQKGYLVMVADGDNKVTPRPVKMGDWYGQDWIVVGGLAAGDRVIVDNLMKLRPGTTVSPKSPENQASAAAGAHHAGAGEHAATDKH